MRYLRIITITIAMGFNTFSVLNAQTIDSSIHQLYFQSVAFPGDFDYSPELLEASGLMKNEVLACLVPLRDTYYQLAQAVITQCEDAHAGDPQGHWACIKDDTNASMAYWSNAMISVVNDGGSWTDTYPGNVLHSGKAMSEQIQPGAWVQGIQIAMPLIQQMITCP